jgi:hypothetical protein
MIAALIEVRRGFPVLRYGRQYQRPISNFGFAFALPSAGLSVTCFGGRFAVERRAHRRLGKPETFNFLGFTFICGISSGGQFQIKRKTRRDRMRAKLKEIKNCSGISTRSRLSRETRSRAVNRQTEAGSPSLGSPLASAIIERVRTGTPTRWASNYENPLALLECGGYDSRGAAPNARRR